MSRKNESYIVAVDFDGTIVKHDYPRIGSPVPGAIEVLKEMTQRGVKIILYTMRHGLELVQAIDYLSDNGIVLWGVNKNPLQQKWTQSPKAYAHLYIDDAAVGCPLIRDEDEERPYVDWEIVRALLPADML